VDRLACGYRLELIDEIERDRGQNRDQEADPDPFEPVGPRALVVDQIAHCLRLKPEALGR